MDKYLWIPIALLIVILITLGNLIVPPFYSGLYWLVVLGGCAWYLAYLVAKHKGE